MLHTPISISEMEGNEIIIVGHHDHYFCSTAGTFAQEIADFIVRACNSYYDLVAALEYIVRHIHVNDEPDIDWLHDKAQSALSKAKGE